MMIEMTAPYGGAKVGGVYPVVETGRDYYRIRLHGRGLCIPKNMARKPTPARVVCEEEEWLGDW